MSVFDARTVMTPSCVPAVMTPELLIAHPNAFAGTRDQVIPAGNWLVSDTEAVTVEVPSAASNEEDRLIVGALGFKTTVTGQWPKGLPYRSEERRVGKECRSRW